jgi:hypothetical protein
MVPALAAASVSEDNFQLTYLPAKGPRKTISASMGGASSLVCALLGHKLHAHRSAMTLNAAN